MQCKCMIRPRVSVLESTHLVLKDILQPTNEQTGLFRTGALIRFFLDLTSGGVSAESLLVAETKEYRLISEG